MKLQKVLPFLFIVYLTSVGFAFSQSTLPVYKNEKAQVEDRVQDLLKRMTLEEKIAILSGAESPEANNNQEATATKILRASNFLSKTKKNVRLGLPQLVMTDGPLGPNGKGGATSYGSAINMAATFDEQFIETVSQNIGAETRDLGYNMILAPCVNIARAPHNGRTFEAYGEDPYLMSRMGVAFVKGVQSQRVSTCTKHYIANNQEWNRMSVDVDLSERALREIYLPAYKAIVQEADGWTIMSAYNQTLGHYNGENSYLLNDVLKKEVGFTGAVVSDWGGTHSTVKAALSGLDLEMPTGRFFSDDLLQAVKDGQVPQTVIDDKASRILRVMFKAGLFDESVADYGGQANTKQRRDLALKMAQKSIVLLKNDNGFLPLKMENYKKIAVIGPNGNVAQQHGGGSGGNGGHYGISPLEGMKNKYGECADIHFERGIAIAKSELPVIPASALFLPDEHGGGHGVWAEYFNNRDLEGQPDLTRVEEQINFDWGYGAFRNPDEPGSPDPAIIETDTWSARWTGKLLSPGTGLYDIGLQADNGVRLYLDGKLVIDAWTDQAPGRYKIAQVEFEENRKYDLRVEFYENWGSCRCIFGMEKYKAGQSSAKAVALANESDLVLLCMGLNPDMEGEAKDRDRLNLPQSQIDLIKSVTAVNKNTLVVLYGATPIMMSEWLDDVPAVVDALYPGQEGGNALADILFGEISPSGKLPLTFPKKWEDTPVAKNYPGDRDHADYSEGIFVGYRHFDKKNIEPLFPFGYGLSYTTFAYSDLKLSTKKLKENEILEVTCTITNTGKMDADESIQLYIHDKKASVAREVKALKAFARVSLKAGESAPVSFKIDKPALSFYDEKAKKWIAEPGEFDVLLGASSRDIRLTASFELR
ncbi:MAG: glycoside hydrolase family 3 C-terminal domain-containing protein [Deferribacteres bacterium]|nr:glycoside hydrolase family 3 C-terminal domain-containing protein [candidate division KSB1 bacterium]MCB9504444.1 glycoside hydrolase family 3 C-terminal domain-containing protein [Deferribacteres bacterium]